MGNCPTTLMSNPGRYCVRFRLVCIVNGVASLHYNQVADSNSTFFFVCICAMASREKMSSESSDTAFVSNCDHSYSCMVRIQSII